MVLGFEFGGSQMLAGTTLSAPGLAVDMAVARFDVTGALAVGELEAPLPEGALKPFPPEESANDIVIDDAGRIIVTGHAPAGLDFGHGPTEGVGAFVVALSPDLTTDWVEHHTSFDHAFGTALALHPSGGVVVLGGGWDGMDRVLMLAALPP